MMPYFNNYLSQVIALAALAQSVTQYVHYENLIVLSVPCTNRFGCYTHTHMTKHRTQLTMIPSRWKRKTLAWTSYISASTSNKKIRRCSSFVFTFSSRSSSKSRLGIDIIMREMMTFYHILYKLTNLEIRNMIVFTNLFFVYSLVMAFMGSLHCNFL